MSCAGPDNSSYDNCFNTLTNKNDQGADIIARLYMLEDKGSLGGGSSTNQIISNIVSYGFTYATLQCRQAFVAEQVITIDCNSAIMGEKVASNKNCQLCKDKVQKLIDARNKLEDDAVKLNRKYQKQTPKDDIMKIINGNLSSKNDGICKYVCSQCVAENLNQNINMKITEQCSQENEIFTTAWSTGMSLAAERELQKHVESLKATGLQISNQADVKSLSIEIANTIKNMTKSENLRFLSQTANLIQQTTIQPNSTSVVLQNVDQAISLTQFASLVSTNYNDNNVQSAIDFKAREADLKQSFDLLDLVKNLERTVKTMSQLLESILGKILLTLLVLIITICLIFASIFFFKPSFIFEGVV
jgi:hypothetical protein